MCTVHDGRIAVCSHAPASEMRRRFPAGPRLDAGAGGRSPDTSPGRWTDHPSAGAGPGCGEVGSGSLARLVDMAFQAPGEPGGDRAGRSSRPQPDTGHRSVGLEPGRPAPPILHPSGEIRCEAKTAVGRNKATAALRRSLGTVATTAHCPVRARGSDPYSAPLWHVSLHPQVLVIARLIMVRDH